MFKRMTSQGVWQSPTLTYSMFALYSFLLLVMVSRESCGQNRLKTLDLSYSEIDPNGLRQTLSNNPAIESINAQSTNFSDSDILLLADNKSIRELNLGSTRISSKSVATLATLRSLEQLDISGTYIYLSSSLPPKLRSLNLSFTKIKDLSTLANLSNLKKLALRFSSINDLSLVRLPASLEELDLTHTSLSDRGTSAIAALANLKILLAGNTKVTDNGIYELRVLKKLSHLDLEDTRISDRSAKVIKTFVSLKKLNVAGTDMGDDGIGVVCENKALESLTIGSVTDKALMNLAKLTNIRRVEVFDAKVTANGVAELAKNTKLKAFALLISSNNSVISIDNQMVDAIAQMRELTELDLRSPFHATNLATLAKSLRLETLSLNLSASDETLEALNLFDKLRELNVMGYMTVERLRNVAKHRKVTRLALGACYINDERVQELVGMDSLEELNLAFNGITDESVGALGRMQNLKELSLVYTRLTEEGVRELRKKLPNCRIAFVRCPV